MALTWSSSGRGIRGYAVPQLGLQEAHPWEHELAHAEHEQVEHPQEPHFAEHAQLPDAQPQFAGQEQAIVRKDTATKGRAANLTRTSRRRATKYSHTGVLDSFVLVAEKKTHYHGKKCKDGRRVRAIPVIKIPTHLRSLMK